MADLRDFNGHKIDELVLRISASADRLRNVQHALLGLGQIDLAQEIIHAANILFHLENTIMPTLDDVLTTAASTIQSLQAQLKAAGTPPPAVLGTVDATTVTDANALGSLVGLAPLDGNPVAPAPAPAPAA